MRVNLIVDDHLLAMTIARAAPEDILTAVRNGELFTTVSWYYRLGRAALNPDTHGALSRQLEEMSPAHQAVVFNAIDVLPVDIGLISLRHLVPVMSELDSSGFRLNVLAAEAAAAALVTHARIVVSTDAPLLATTCEQLGIQYDVLAV